MQNFALISASLAVLGSFEARIRLTLAISKYDVEYASSEENFFRLITFDCTKI